MPLPFSRNGRRPWRRGSMSAARTQGLLANLCQRLDGIPLAIELAAVRLASLDLDQLTEALSDQLPILGHGDRSGSMRQQTLDATIDWSYELLSEVEQILWARLSVFAGGFDCSAVEQVCCEGRVLEFRRNRGDRGSHGKVDGDPRTDD